MRASVCATSMASLSSSMKERNLSHNKAGIFRFPYSHWLKCRPELRILTLIILPFENYKYVLRSGDRGGKKKGIFFFSHSDSSMNQFNLNIWPFSATGIFLDCSDLRTWATQGRLDRASLEKIRGPEGRVWGRKVGQIEKAPKQLIVLISVIWTVFHARQCFCNYQLLQGEGNAHFSCSYPNEDKIQLFTFFSNAVLDKQRSC